MFFLQKADFLLITLFSAPGRSGLGPDATVSGTGCPALAAVKRERGNVPCFAGRRVNGSGQRPPCRRPCPRTMLWFYFVLCGRPKDRPGRERPWRGQLRPSSKSASASRSTAICRPSSDPQLVSENPLNGAPCRHRPRCRGGRRLSAMELPVRRLPPRLGGR